MVLEVTYSSTLTLVVRTQTAAFSRKATWLRTCVSAGIRSSVWTCLDMFGLHWVTVFAGTGRMRFAQRVCGFFKLKESNRCDSFGWPCSFMRFVSIRVPFPTK